MPCSADLATLVQRSAALVELIFKGAKPPDLPVEQHHKYELAINPKTAIGCASITIPRSLPVRADEAVQ